MDRRSFLRASLRAGAGVLLIGACDAGDGLLGGSDRRPSPSLNGRPDLPLEPGSTWLGVGDPDALLYVPSSAIRRASVPVIVSLHGARHGGVGSPGRYRTHADRHGIAVVVPEAAGPTWDAVMGTDAGDAEVIAAALRATSRRVPIDQDRLAVAGFSDGASYALSIGLTNGNVFSHVMAHSPGFIPGPDPHGDPRFFISHGTRDGTLPIDATSREIVPELRADGYDVHYVEFDGTHEAPDAIVARAVRWFIGSSATTIP